MTWDPSQPADTTKIRNLGVVIRPNWEAIEKADLSFKPQAINLNNRTQLPPEVPDNPTPIENAYITFSKEDSTGIAQLWGVDPENNISQLTSSDFLIEQNGFVLLPPNLWFQWGRQTVTGDPAGGSFVVTFPKEFGAIPFSIQVTLYQTPTNSNASGGFGINNTGTITTTGFTATNFNSGVPANSTMGWMAIGSK